MITIKKNIRLFRITTALLVLISCNQSEPAEQIPDNIYYTCSMDPQVMEKKPGTCPICKMNLVRVEVDPNQKSGEIKLSSQQMELANISTDTARLRPIGDEITLSAVLKENQNNINIVAAKVPGRIERLYIRNIGEPVKIGQAVFELYSEQLSAAQEDYLLALQSKKRYAETDSKFARIVDAARNKLLLWGMNEAQISEIEQSGRYKNTLTYYSKYAGIATIVNVSEGDYITEGSPVLRVTDLHSLWAEAQLYVSDLPYLSRTDDALIDIPSHPDQKSLRGKVSFVNPALENASKIIIIRVDVPNNSMDFQPGLQAWVTLKGKTTNSVAVPNNALLRSKDGTTIWIRNPEGAFESRMVTTGKSNRDFTEITIGLKPGEVVVTTGAYLLQSELVFKKGANSMAGHEM